MELEFTDLEGTTIARLVAADGALATPQDALELVANAAYGGASHALVEARHLPPAFFALRTGLAGEMLQKASNYRIGLVVVGDLGPFRSDALDAFVAESNRGRQVAFVPDEEAARAAIAHPALRDVLIRRGPA